MNKKGMKSSQSEKKYIEKRGQSPRAADDLEYIIIACVIKRIP